MTGRYDVFGLGQCSLDRILVVPRFPAPDGKVEGRGWREQGGGPVANALHALAGWGRRCAFAGVAGDDGAAPQMAAELEAAGVDTSRLIVRPGTLLHRRRGGHRPPPDPLAAPYGRAAPPR